MVEANHLCLHCLKEDYEAGAVVHICNPSYGEVESKRIVVQVKPGEKVSDPKSENK